MEELRRYLSLGFTMDEAINLYFSLHREETRKIFCERHDEDSGREKMKNGVS